MFLHHMPLPRFPTFSVLQFVSQFHELMKVTLYSCHFPEEKLLHMCQHRFKRPPRPAKKNKTKTHGSSILSDLEAFILPICFPLPYPHFSLFPGSHSLPGPPHSLSKQSSAKRGEEAEFSAFHSFSSPKQSAGSILKHGHFL